MKKFIPLISAVIAVCFLFAGCGSASSNYSKDSMSITANEYDSVGEYYENSTTADDNGGVDGGVDTKLENTVPTGRKIILTATINYETKKYDESLQLVLKEITANGGYVQSSIYYGDNSEYSTRSCSITARIPSDNYSEFLNKIEGAGSLVRKNESSDDITAQYVDVEARLSSLRTEEATLLGILEQATTIEDVIVLQDKLAEVRYQIEYYTSTQRTYDDLVSYSTITVELDEVREYTPVQQGFGDRVKTAVVDSATTFVNGVQDVIIAFIFLLPSLVLLAVIVLIIVLIVKLSKKHRRKKFAAMPQPLPMPVPGAPAVPVAPVNNARVQNVPNAAAPTNNAPIQQSLEAQKTAIKNEAEIDKKAADNKGKDNADGKDKK